MSLGDASSHTNTFIHSYVHVHICIYLYTHSYIHTRSSHTHTHTNLRIRTHTNTHTQSHSKTTLSSLLICISFIHLQVYSCTHSLIFPCNLLWHPSPSLPLSLPLSHLISLSCISVFFERFYRAEECGASGWCGPKQVSAPALHWTPKFCNIWIFRALLSVLIFTIFLPPSFFSCYTITFALPLSTSTPMTSHPTHVISLAHIILHCCYCCYQRAEWAHIKGAGLWKDLRPSRAGRRRDCSGVCAIRSAGTACVYVMCLMHAVSQQHKKMASISHF